MIDFRLKGRTVLLTGAAGYFGAAIAEGLVGSGAEVILCGRTLENLDRLSENLNNSGGNTRSLRLDIGDEKSRLDSISWLYDNYDCLDGIVNNAYSGRAGIIESINGDDFSVACEQNIAGPFHLIQKTLDLLEKSSVSASIVNVSSMYGKVSPDPRIYGDSGQNNPVHYGATKAGLIQMTRYLACHLADRNIRVNAVSPGAFPRPEVRESAPDFLQRLQQKIPMNRIGAAGEVVGPVLFLLSSASSYVTGVDLPVDGGWTAW